MVVNKVTQQIVVDFCSKITLEDILNTYKEWFRNNPEFKENQYSLLELVDTDYMIFSGIGDELPTTYAFEFGLSEIDGTPECNTSIKEFKPDISKEDWNILTHNGKDLSNYEEVLKKIEEPIVGYLKELGLHIVKTVVYSDCLTFVIDNNHLIKTFGNRL